MISNQMKASLRRQYDKIQDAETRIAALSCNGEYVRVNSSDLRCVMPEFGDRGEYATLRYLDGGLFFLVHAGTGDPKDWAMVDLPFPIQIVLASAVTDLIKHCEKFAAKAEKEAEARRNAATRHFKRTEERTYM